MSQDAKDKSINDLLKMCVRPSYPMKFGPHNRYCCGMPECGKMLALGYEMEVKTIPPIVIFCWDCKCWSYLHNQTITGASE